MMNTKQAWLCALLLLAVNNFGNGRPSMGQTLREIESILDEYVAAENPNLEAIDWSLAPGGRWVVYMERPMGGLVHIGTSHDIAHVFDLQSAIKIRAIRAYDWSWDADEGLWYIDAERKLFRLQPEKGEPVPITLPKQLAQKDLFTVVGVDAVSVLLEAQDRGAATFPGDLYLINLTKPEKIEDWLPAGKIEGGWDRIFPLGARPKHFALYRSDPGGELGPTLSVWTIRPFRLLTKAPLPPDYHIRIITEGWQVARPVVVACAEDRLSPVVFLLTEDKIFELFAWPEKDSPCAMRIWETCSELTAARMKSGRLEFIFSRRVEEMPRLYYVQRDGTMSCE